ncbi:MAG TPA: succinylglutamate desuccinylase/aspartoacylase family protein [bacterium]|nr:succinylglutamate desuccinylase/aspartoacylase family protein [bacterium]
MSTVTVGSVTAGPGEKVFGYVDVFELPASVVRVPVWIINSGTPGPRVAVTAGMHGTEYVGIEAATRLARQTNTTDIRGTLAVFPVVNVLGFEAADVLTVPVDGLNLNRVFPGDPSGSPSYVLAHFLFESVRRIADAAIDLHGGDSAQALHPFGVCYETGEADVDRRSMEMARLFDMPFIWAMGAQRGHAGMMISELNKCGIPAAIGEAGDLGTCREEDVRLHLRGVANILKSLGAIEGTPELILPSPPDVFRHNFPVVAHRGGVFDARVPIGARVSRGELLGVIKNIEGDTVEDVTSPHAGVIMSCQSARVVHPGSRLYHALMP